MQTSLANVPSFSEAMLQRSAIPILTTGPDARVESEKRRTCLAAIDVNSHDLAAYIDKIIDLAKANGLVVIFFHAMRPSPFDSRWGDDPVVLDPGSLLHPSLTEEHQRALSKIAEVTRHAEFKGCLAMGHLLISMHSTAAAILYAAEAERAALIALASRSIPLSWITSQSVSRDMKRIAAPQLDPARPRNL